MKFSSKRPINDSLYGYGSHKLVIKANFVLTLNGSVNSPFEPLLTYTTKKKIHFPSIFLTKRHEKTRPNRPPMRGRQRAAVRLQNAFLATIKGPISYISKEMKEIIKSMFINMILFLLSRYNLVLLRLLASISIGQIMCKSIGSIKHLRKI